ncbi:MAG: DUF2158 domain-containing protein [Desulfobacterales bacterium]|jgi:uncharacterized protein YodC (DUF2158 family)|nr:DUF2158 domain-containing protein [Desulfobacterales bacterium]
MSKLKEGDIVQLKSGGPKMTIQEVTERNRIICQWFKGASLEWATFPLTSLIKVDDKNDD